MPLAAEEIMCFFFHEKNACVHLSYEKYHAQTKQSAW